MTNDVSIALVLYAVVVTEGMRRLPARAVVMRRFLFGRWSIAGPGQLPAGLRLLTWCPSASAPLALAPAADVDSFLGVRRRIHRMQARLRRTRGHVAWLRALGALAMVAFVAGVPAATHRAGIIGLLAALGVVVTIAAIAALIVFRALRRIGVSNGAAFVAAARVLNPFATPHASELVETRAARGAPVLCAAWVLAGGPAVVGAERPLVFDALRGRADDPDARALRAFVGDADLETTLYRGGERFGDGNRTFCPRCGSEYVVETSDCADCVGVALVGSGHGGPTV